MIKHPCCIHNGKEIWIYNLYTVENGKQINNPDVLAALRAYADKKELFCRCGCGRNMCLVAGDKMLKTQHFRHYPGQDGFSDIPCKATYESEESIAAKLVLKCWLDHTFSLATGEVLTDVPISSIMDGMERRFEFTHYIPKKDFGLCFVRLGSNISDEKMDYLEVFRKERLLYVLDICNFNKSGQYPEHAFEVQDRQGFCMLLDCHGGYDFFGADATIVYYARNYNRCWTQLEVIKDKLQTFSFDDKGNLIYNGTAVITLVFERLDFFRKEQEEKLAEAKRKGEAYQKRLKEERERREREEQEKREKELVDLEEKEKLASLEVGKELELKSKSVFELHPKYERLYMYVRDLEYISGFFDQKQDDGRVIPVQTMIDIKVVTFDDIRERICLKGKDGRLYYIYLSDVSAMKIGTCGHHTPYIQLDLSKCGIDEVVNVLKMKCYCRKNNDIQKVYCGVNIGCPYAYGEENLCNMKESQCGFKEWR